MTLTIVVVGLLVGLTAVAVGIFAVLNPSRNAPPQYRANDEETTAAERLLRHRG